ncbi:hypothetical protein [Phenylobacterium sp.]|uniref:hypothetical protein n=1 Tax=Phenylobacterium sp. TaxID=1871053 RepID=UPI00374D754C
MRIAALIAISMAALLSGSAAFAAPASVSVTVGPALQAEAVKTLGVREVNDLAAQLQRTVEKRLAKSPGYDGARIELVLSDAKPNHPTFKQMGDRPGLSYESFGVGGAKIEGRAVAADGAVTPIAYKYYESDIRWARYGGTWADAEGTFQRFAYDLGRGRSIASR